MIKKFALMAGKIARAIGAGLLMTLLVTGAFATFAALNFIYFDWMQMRMYSDDTLWVSLLAGFASVFTQWAAGYALARAWRGCRCWLEEHRFG